MTDSTVGKRFGRLVVLDHFLEDHESFAKCICDCGVIKIIYVAGLIRGKTKSCGCLKAELSAQRMSTHGDSKSIEYRTWKSIRIRCNPRNKNKPTFKSWAGRGITVCDRWSVYENFLADMGRIPEGDYSIDRINNNGNYEPNNCRWATRTEQNRNQRKRKPPHARKDSPKITYNGTVKYVYDWAKEFNIKPSTITKRIRRGWSVDDAITKPNGTIINKYLV